VMRDPDEWLDGHDDHHHQANLLVTILRSEYAMTMLAISYAVREKVTLRMN
jgi:hypothetical protein